MGTTPGGLPYPDGTSKVVDGDNAIKALAEAVEYRGSPAIAEAFNSSGTVQNLGATNVDLTSVSITFTLSAARDVKFTWGMQTYADNLSAVTVIDLIDNGSVRRTSFHPGNGSPTSVGLNFNAVAVAPIRSFAAGAHTVKLAARRAGSGIIVVTHASTSPSFLMAEIF